MTLKEEIARIQALPATERVAGYLARNASLAEFGARLRANNRPDSDWSEAEIAQWGALCDELDAWAYALSDEEIRAIEPASLILSSLCRGEWPRLISHRVERQAVKRDYVSLIVPLFSGIGLLWAFRLVAHFIVAYKHHQVSYLDLFWISGEAVLCGTLLYVAIICFVEAARILFNPLGKEDD
jgi:hypothetical protein